MGPIDQRERSGYAAGRVASVALSELSCRGDKHGGAEVTSGSRAAGRDPQSRELFLSRSYWITTATPCVAFVMIVATACGCDT